MDSRYLNHSLFAARDRWQRYQFLRQWWAFYARDPYWAPPDYATLSRALRPNQYPYLQARRPQLLFMEAARRRVRRSPLRSDWIGSDMTVEWARPVASAVLLQEGDGSHRIALLRCVNDAETLSRFLQQVATETGGQSLIGPTHLSPYLGAGALNSHWNALPPAHTPYNPPFLPDLLAEVMKEVAAATLFRLDVHSSPSTVPGPAALRPVSFAEPGTELENLLTGATSPWQLFVPPDRHHVRFILDWLGRDSLQGWLAQVEGANVGIILLRPDLAPVMRQAGGGRNPLQRLWLRYFASRRATQGRVLFGGVLPAWRRRGIGRQLLNQALAAAHALGWNHLHVGPIPTAAAAVDFLQAHGAQAERTYRIFRWDAPTWF